MSSITFVMGATPFCRIVASGRLLTKLDVQLEYFVVRPLGFDQPDALRLRT